MLEKVNFCAIYIEKISIFLSNVRESEFLCHIYINKKIVSKINLR